MDFVVVNMPMSRLGSPNKEERSSTAKFSVLVAAAEMSRHDVSVAAKTPEGEGLIVSRRERPWGFINQI